MLDFIKNYYSDIIVVVLFIIGMLLLYKNNKRDIVRKIVLSLVVQAEKALGSGTGELKYAWVIEQFYDKLPKTITILFTKKEVDQMIEDAVQCLKDILAEGVNLSSYDDEVYINTLTSNT